MGTGNRLCNKFMDLGEMSSEVMDYSLWDPPYVHGFPIFISATTEIGSYMGHGCQYDFFFDYGHDVIEETALNEKYCIQVLRILIGKADNDIIELEEELDGFRCQLAWADEEWSDFCSAFLKEKINCLDVSIQNLKNKQGDDDGNCLPMHREPVERMDDIVKVVFSDYFQQKNEQFLDIIPKESRLDLLREKKPLRKSASDSNRKEIAKDTIVTFAQKPAISRTCLKSRGKDADHIGTIKRTICSAKDSSLDSLQGLTKRKRKLSQSKCPRTTEANTYIMTCRDNSITQRSSVQTQLEWRHDQEMIKSQNEQPSNILVQNPTLDAEKPTIIHLEERKPRSPELKVSIENVRVNCLNTSGPTVELSLKPEKKRKNIEEKKPTIAMVEDTFSRCASPTNGEKCPIKIESETIQNDSQVCVSTKSSKPVKSVDARVMGTALPEKFEPADTSLSSSSDALKEVTKETNVKPRQTIGGPDVTSKRRDESNSVLGKKRNRTKHTSAEILDRRKNTTNSDPKKKLRLQLKQYLKADITSEEKGYVSNLSLKQGNCLMEGECTLNPENVQEPSLSVEFRLSSSSKEKYKRLMSGKIKKKNVKSNLSHAEEPISPSEKSREQNSSSPGWLEGIKELRSTEISLAKFHDDATYSMSKEDFSITEDHFAGNSNIVPHRTPNLYILTPADLKAIAKQRGLKGYSKLRKAELLELLEITHHVKGEKRGDIVVTVNEGDP